MKKRRISFSVSEWEYEFVEKYADTASRTIPNLAYHAFIQHLKRYANYRQEQVESVKLESSVKDAKKSLAGTGISPNRVPSDGFDPSTLQNYSSDPVLSNECLKWFVENLAIEGEGYIYFIKDKSSDLVKIGYSVRPEKRIKNINLQTPGGVTVLAIIFGGYSAERWLHNLLKHDHVRGEWFNYNENAKKVISFIEGS